MYSFDGISGQSGKAEEVQCYSLALSVEPMLSHIVFKQLKFNHEAS